jgi:dihydrofolate synthase/folylpolyglutamate synthase
LERARDFLGFLGNPQDTFPIVHVSGTSGKGSTCTAIASVLTHAGYRTGLATSPYLQVATEKLQIGQRLIAPGDFASLVDDVLDAAGRWQRRARLERPLSYGEVWVSLMATWFARDQVDLAVIEVGAGGRFDVTNLVRPLVTVVTSVGLDHTATLGPTVEDIAWHKAGIFKRGAAAVTAAADPVALAVLRREAESRGVSLTEVDPERSIEVIASDRAGTRWRMVDEAGQPASPVIQMPQPGGYQAVNGATAVTALRLLERHGFRVSDDDMQAGLAATRLPGRAELMPVSGPPAVLIDVAHNPDKVRALVSGLPFVLGGTGHGAAPPVLLTGALSGKDAGAMMELLVPIISAVVTTAAGVTGKNPISAEMMAETVRQAGFQGVVAVEPDPSRALATAISLARDRGVSVLGTGSLYLAGRIREHWYPADEILRQQTPWPVASDLVLH